MSAPELMCCVCLTLWHNEDLDDEDVCIDCRFEEERTARATFDRSIDEAQEEDAWDAKREDA